MTVARTPTEHCRAAALGDHAGRPARRRSARSRPRCAPASRPPAAPSRRSSPSIEAARRAPRSTEIDAAKRARRDRLAGHRLRRHRGRHRHRRASWHMLQPPRLPGRARPLRPRAGPRLGPRHRRLRRGQPVLRELPRPRRRLLRQRRLQARDLPDLLVTAPRCRPGRATGWRRVQAFLNSQWTHESDGVQWFDPDRDSLYPDRIRRRPQGADSGGLGTHLDPGTLDLWMTQAYQKAFRHLFDGTVEQYDPWDAAYRTAGPQYPGTTMCSAFRTFQGWTALSDMDHDQGVLHTVPIPEAMAYLMLRPLLSDVARRRHVRRHRQPGLPGQREVAPAAACEALSRHPGRPGRRLRLVALRHDPQRRAGRPTRRAGATSCTSPPRPGARATRRYAASVREAFLTGSSPSRLPRRALRARLAQPLPARGPQRHRPARPRPRVRPQLHNPVAVSRPVS